MDFETFLDTPFSLEQIGGTGNPGTAVEFQRQIYSSSHSGNMPSFSTVLQVSPNKTTSGRRQWLANQLTDYLIRIADEKHACANCGASYTPINNMGHLYCNFHPGDRIGHTWTCCGGQGLSEGCVKSDHWSQTFAAQGGRQWPMQYRTMRVPALLADYLKIPAASRLKLVEGVKPNLPPEYHYYVVRRTAVDAKTP